MYICVYIYIYIYIQQHPSPTHPGPSASGPFPPRSFCGRPRLSPHTSQAHLQALFPRPSPAPLLPGPFCGRPHRGPLPGSFSGRTPSLPPASQLAAPPPF